MKTLLRLAVDGASLFDGSSLGMGLLSVGNAKVSGGAPRFAQGGIEFARNAELDAVQTFTVSATITPEQIGPDRRNIAEGQTPALALFLDGNGHLIGSVNTAAGWVSVDSGATVVKANQTAQVRFYRDGSGGLGLEIDGKLVGQKTGTSALVAAGGKGIVVGSWIDGARWPFVGKIVDLCVQQGVASSKWVAEVQSKASAIKQSIISRTGIGRVIVELLPDASHQRLQPIKDIMNAAGVERLSDLDALHIRVPTTMTRGKVLVAPRKLSVAPQNWSNLAKEFARAGRAGKQQILAGTLGNRNSAKLLTASGNQPSTPSRPTTPGRIGSTPLVPGGRVIGLGENGRTSVRLPSEVLRASPSLRLLLQPSRLSEKVKLKDGALEVLDADLLRALQDANPVNWPQVTQGGARVMELKTIPINSAVIIAGTLDLTETQLVVEPNVETLYIIAEQIICGNSATITWRKPGGTTPARADNPDLNGRGYSGVQTKADSRDGLDGEDGSAGEAGIDGRAGLHSPKLEVWVKNMTDVPNFDLSGEDGIKGGRGQHGGRGGDGADGHVGERIWVFGWWCTADPGDGGNGGNGGSGGRGGRGGNGGNGGKITIGVLEGTLETTVTSHSFKIKNQAGRKGRGGDGGEGGDGGYGGRSGVGDTCHDAEDGVKGAKGQPGAVGPDGGSDGVDGEVQFFQFSEMAWNDMMTRPWLSQVSPVQVFPGDRLTLRGSRFSSSDRVMFGSLSLSPTINADESISVTIPLTASGGITSTYVRRQDGTESNRLNVWVKPQLDALPTGLAQGAQVQLSGRAFVGGASVLVNGAAIAATASSATQITFTMPGTGGSGSSGGEVSIAVRNPDGMVSNSRQATLPYILEVPFRFGSHNLSFVNFSDGVPDWGTYETTFGAAEVWHELLDPIFGHPILTTAFYFFYEYFLKGRPNGGLATGFCTSMSAMVADRFWQGLNDTPTLTKAGVHKQLTAIHGRLLSRESLLTFHDQGCQGVARVEQSAREIEATFLRGTDRSNAPLLFFIPSGDIWDSGYFDKLSSSHCVMPYRFVYPTGRPAPALTADATSTTTDLDGVELYVWDCNHPGESDQGKLCRLRFRRTSGQLHFDYFAGNTSTPQFSSEQGITLGMMTNGDYNLADHDLPFSGPFGLSSFIIDFLLSPADLQITNATGLRTGNYGGQILSEIPGSHPCYLVKGAYMLPPGNSFTRQIVGNGVGKYRYNSILPEGVSITLEDVDTAPGQIDVLSVSADATQIRFTPGTDKLARFTISRIVGNQARALTISGMGGSATAAIDITMSPDLSLLRMGNQGANRAGVEVRAFSADKVTRAKVNQQVAGVSVPTDHDLTIAVADWTTAVLTVEAVPFP